MITVKANRSIKNVDTNALAGVQLYKDTVFFGINGAGKSTVCEVLSRGATLEDDREDITDPPRVYSFDDTWRSENVGDFVEGGSAKGVTTVILDDKAGDLERQIREAEKENNPRKPN